MERTSLCVACVEYGLCRVDLAVDPACGSEREADRLCVVHRARMTEGYCVLCGRRAPWVSPWPKSEIGACEPCFGEIFGPALADRARETCVFDPNPGPPPPFKKHFTKGGEACDTVISLGP